MKAIQSRMVAVTQNVKRTFALWQFRRQAGLYLTIPVASGLINWSTNKLAVWMIFEPQVRESVCEGIRESERSCVTCSALQYAGTLSVRVFELMASIHV